MWPPIDDPVSYQPEKIAESLGQALVDRRRGR